MKYKIYIKNTNKEELKIDKNDFNLFLLDKLSNKELEENVGDIAELKIYSNSKLSDENFTSANEFAKKRSINLSIYDQIKDDKYELTYYNDYKYKPQPWDKRNNRPVVLIDMDDCINDFLSYLCESYGEETGTFINPKEITDWDLTKKFGNDVYDFFTQEGFFENIPDKRGSISAIKKLIKSTKYDIYIVTACQTNHELEEKCVWLSKFIPEFNLNRIIKCSEKHIIRGDVLIDDREKNLDDCNPYMRCILFDAPHNKECTKYTRIKSLGKALPILEKWFYGEE